VRCLLEDLADSVEDPEQRSTLMSGSLPGPSVPLHTISHPIIHAAVVRYSGSTRPVGRELVKKVRDQLWAKCRHGERWRGIVCWSLDGPRWLCFAGWHEQGDPDDVYTEFEQNYAVAGSSEAFLPDGDDEQRLKIERIFQEKEDLQLRLRVLVVNTLLQALATRNEVQVVTLPSGSTLKLEVSTGTDEPGADDWICDLFLQIGVNWTSGAGAHDVVDVQDSIPGVTSEEWLVDPATHTGGDPRFFVTVDETWAQRVLANAEEHGAEALSRNPLLVLEEPDGLAHYATRHDVDFGYFEGSPLQSLCGRRFVPRNDPGGRQICQECDHTKAAFDLVRATLRGDS